MWLLAGMLLAALIALALLSLAIELVLVLLPYVMVAYGLLALWLLIAGNLPPEARPHWVVGGAILGGIGALWLQRRHRRRS